MKRISIKVAGESGQGVNSVGEILAKTFKSMGFYVFAYREYPSLIRGGWASYQIDVNDRSINSSRSQCDLLVCQSRRSIRAYLDSIVDGGQLLHTLKAYQFSAEEKEIISRKNLTVEYLDAEQIALKAGGKLIMANVVLIGVLLQLYGLSHEIVDQILQNEFGHKQAGILEANQACLTAGLNYQLTLIHKPDFQLQPDQKLHNSYLLTGNHAMALGAVAAGVRAYYAYPMTPSSSILTSLADWYHQTGMLVKQVEDEISVAQMSIGSMHMGVRTLCGTSGGGFDLMTESLSLAGMIEVPWVCILAQRPGPATGLPTWTSASDLNLAIYAGHGEFARIVLSASDAESAYLLTQRAFNLAEKFQVPVIVLTEKQVAESLFMINKIPASLKIERHLANKSDELKPEDRYKLTESGVSTRWYPGDYQVTFNANGDEHLSDGSLTEDAEPSRLMYEKRIKKETAILADLAEPKYFGPDNPELVLIGWGGVKGAVLDALQELESPKIGYLHYEDMYPLKTKTLQKWIDSGTKLVLVENNYSGQLGQLIARETGFMFTHKLLKYDGRPFFVEDILNYLNKNSL